MKKLTTLILICAATFAANAQYGQRLFYYSATPFTYERLNDGIYSTLNLNAALPTYASVGRADSNGVTHSRFVRLSNTGTTLNNRLYMLGIAAGKLSTNLESICERPAQNFMAGSAGGAFGTNIVAGGRDVLLLRSNASGVLSAAQMIDLSGGGYDEAACIDASVFQPGRTLTCGYTHLGTTTKAFVMKSNATGYQAAWVRYYDLICNSGVNAQTFATSLIEGPAGIIYIVGYMTDNGGGGCDNGFISKFSATGAHIGTFIFNEAGTTNGLRFNSIKAIPSSPGNYIIGGDYIRYNTTNLNNDPLPYVMTVNLAGLIPVVSISQAYNPITVAGSINYASGEDVTSRFNPNTSAYEYFIGGKFILNSSTNTDGYIIKIAQTGAPMAGRRFGRSGTDAFHALDAVGNGANVNDGIAAFGEYVDISSASLPRGCYWVKPFYNLMSGCYQNNLNPVAIPVLLAATAVAPVIGNTFTQQPLSYLNVNCITKNLCLSATVVGGSNLKQAIAANDVENVNVYPSPASTILNIDFESIASSDIEIQVFDITGKVVMNQKASIDEGGNSLILNIESLSSGIYMLQINDGEQQIHRKFVKQ